MCHSLAKHCYNLVFQGLVSRLNAAWASPTTTASQTSGCIGQFVTQLLPIPIATYLTIFIRQPPVVIFPYPVCSNVLASHRRQTRQVPL